MLKLVLAGSLVAGLLGTGIADAPTPNDRVVIDSVFLNGSGCSPGTAAVAVSPDNTQFIVTYSNFMASVGIGASPTDMRKTCQISLVVHPPAGQTYALGGMSHRGFASLATGASAVLRKTLYFQGQSTSPLSSSTFTGAMSDDVLVDDIPDRASMVFAPCGGLPTLNINLDLRATAGTSDTRKTTSFIALNESVPLSFVLRPCPST